MLCLEKFSGSCVLETFQLADTNHQTKAYFMCSSSQLVLFHKAQHILWKILLEYIEIALML